MRTKNLLLLLFVLLICNSLSAQNFDFRNTKWGMDSTQVKNAETSKLISSKKGTLMYSGKMGDLDCRIAYDFCSSNQLCHAGYMIILDDKNPQSYVDTYLVLQELLTKKYKEPYKKLASSINGKILTQDEWASNLISDNLNLETRWKINSMEVNLSLFCPNDLMYIEINYSPLDNGIKQTEEKKARIYKDL